MIKESYIYNGEVIHKRFKPKVHYFKYKVFSLFIDLDELSKINKLIPYFSYNKFISDRSNNIEKTLYLKK